MSVGDHHYGYHHQAYTVAPAPERWPAAYLTVVGLLAGLGALADTLVFYLSIFATDNCSAENPAFRCTTSGILTMLGLPWCGLVLAVAASVVPGLIVYRGGGSPWWFLPLGAVLYLASLAGTWLVMTS
ncbi:hypothetical protein ABZ922_18560 [Streptomyces shenzhenensis]|uniref:hypothetical protein n=1 Tax=Streptomyces shenzhenensis TaxID=943815 RepID=UPI0033E44F3E